jgi:hypothetical protein
LVDKRIVGRKRKTPQDGAGNLLKQASLETGANALDDKPTHTIGVANREHQSNDAAERQTHYRGTLQSQLIDDFSQVIHEIVKRERVAQQKAIVLAAQLIANDTERSREGFRKRAKQVKPAT